MSWRKLGKVWAPSGERWWARSHAHLPTAQLLDDRLRVWVACLDARQHGRLGWVDLDLDDPTRVVDEAAEPALDLGQPGTFDDCGVVPSCVVSVGDRVALYYVGFQRMQGVPYMLYTGLAWLDAGGVTRAQATPVLDRTADEPFSRGAPCVLADGDRGYRMWYWSCTHWSPGDGASPPHYNTVIRRATSRDGLEWRVDPGACIEPGPDAYAVGRPWVVRADGGFRMWYSVRSSVRPYRIASAESDDGLTWRPRGATDLEPSGQGWDAATTCYPCVFDLGDRRLILYNGDGHGRTGFGLAEQVPDAR